MLEDLRKSLKDAKARFAFVFLIDDFIASGTTLLRWEADRNEWNGKLYRFWEDLEKAGVLGTHFEDQWTLCVHHYLATQRGKETAERRNHEAREARTAAGKGWFDRVLFSYGTVLSENLPIDEARHREFAYLVQRYYDDSIETSHMKLGGEDARLGFGKCALPLVLAHNTPNNSIALLWAETLGRDGKHAMRPLFRRRQRHM